MIPSWVMSMATTIVMVGVVGSILWAVLSPVYYDWRKRKEEEE